jgi:mannose-1-phosphate guanylyltransferase
LHQIEALVKVRIISSHAQTLSDSQAGVKDIVLAVNYRPEVMVSVLKKTEEELGINITFSVETEPLGTGEPTLHFRESEERD